VGLLGYFALDPGQREAIVDGLLAAAAKSDGRLIIPLPPQG